MNDFTRGYMRGYKDAQKEALNREAMDSSPNGEAQPEQEPVAWIYEDELPESYPYDAMFEKSRVIDGVRMFPQIKNLKHEPVLIVEKEPAYMSQGHYYEGTKPHIDPTKVWKLAIGTKLYTTPPQPSATARKPLTDEQMLNAFNSCEKVIDGLHAVAELSAHGITASEAEDSQQRSKT